MSYTTCIWLKVFWIRTLKNVRGYYCILCLMLLLQPPISPKLAKLVLMLTEEVGNKNVIMTPGWPCNKPDLTMKETALYSAAMTPGKHGPHKYPWSFARLQYPRTSANTTSGRQYYRWHFKKDHIYGKILAVAFYLLNKLNRIHLPISHPQGWPNLKTTLFSAKVRVKTVTFVAWKSTANPSQASAGPKAVQG